MKPLRDANWRFECNFRKVNKCYFRCMTKTARYVPSFPYKMEK